MHDLKLIRENPELFDKALARRGLEAKSSEVLVLDESIRKSTTELQELQARRNEIAKEIPAFKKEGKNCYALFAEAEKIKASIPSLEFAVGESQKELENILSAIPNMVDDSVPDGKEDADDREEKRVGEPTKLAFKAKEHFELGENLGVMYFELTAKFCGSRFVTLKGKLAR
ncbi:MAG: serine--tRNA ligase, partial [Alphaproteobacteria bacterium]